MLPLLIYLQQAGVSPQLGTWGTILITILGLGSLSMNGWLVHRLKTNSALKEAVDAYKEEMTVYKSKAERLEAELGIANQTIGQLNAKTDLTAAMALIRESMESQRKFERETAQVQSSITTILDRLITGDTEHYKQIADNISGCTDAIRELREEVRTDREDSSRAFASIAGSLKQVEQRLAAGNM